MTLKLHTIITLCIIYPLFVPAQSVSGKIEYTYDQKLTNVKLSRSATLIFSEDASVFYHSRGSGIVAVDIDGNVGGPDLEYTTGPDHDGSPVIDFYRKDALGNTIYANFGQNTMRAREMVLLRPYAYDEPGIPRIDWQPVDTSKMIGSYLCLAARARFRGRDYLAWYTPELPYPFGPWKLTGLPGVILEATDTEQRVVFHVTSITLNLSPERLAVVVPPPAEKHEITFAEFQHVHQKERRRLLRQASSTNERGQGGESNRTYPAVEIFPEQ